MYIRHNYLFEKSTAIIQYGEEYCKKKLWLPGANLDAIKAARNSLPPVWLKQYDLISLQPERLRGKHLRKNRSLRKRQRR